MTAHDSCLRCAANQQQRLSVMKGRALYVLATSLSVHEPPRPPMRDKVEIIMHSVRQKERKGEGDDQKSNQPVPVSHTPLPAYAPSSPRNRQNVLWPKKTSTKHKDRKFPELEPCRKGGRAAEMSGYRAARG
uniref:Uncharacterized protein n=1 Tax=Bionectria ochroleuca TaxID=29856 RepID=A0A8H7NCV5_BIOOC